MRPFTILVLATSVVASVVQLSDRAQPKVSSLGCFTSPSSSSALASGVSPSSLTLEGCMAACAGSPYFSVQGGTDCRCSQNPPAGSADPDKCTTHCTGNRFEICGGIGYSNFYSLGGGIAVKRAIGDMPIDKRELVARGSAAPVVTTGCYTFSSLTSLFSVKSTLSLQDLRVEDCMAYCTGSTYFGVAYGNTCFCYTAGLHSNTLPAPLSAAKCSLTCSGNFFELCGASGGAFLYAYSKPATSASSCPRVTTTIISTSTGTRTVSATTSKLSTSTKVTSSSKSSSTTAAATSSAPDPNCTAKAIGGCFYIIGHGESHIEGLKLGWEEGEGNPQFNYPATPFWIDANQHLHTANAYSAVTMTYYMATEMWWGMFSDNVADNYPGYQRSTCTASPNGTFSCYQYSNINSNLVNVWELPDGDDDSRGFYLPHWGTYTGLNFVPITLTWQATTCPSLC